MANSVAAAEMRPCVVWSPDCQGKWDYDGRLISISCRYWPTGGGFHILGSDGFHQSKDPAIRPSAIASIHLNHGDPDENGFGDYETLARQEFDGGTEAEVKAAVEQWVATKFREVTDILTAHFAAREGAMTEQPIRSRPYSTEAACERCVFGQGNHSDWCAEGAPSVVIKGGANCCSRCGWQLTLPSRGCHEVKAGSGRVKCVTQKVPDAAIITKTGRAEVERMHSEETLADWRSRCLRAGMAVKYEQGLLMGRL